MEDVKFIDRKLNKHYKNGLNYQKSMGFTEKWPEYERFLAGDQWPAVTEKTKGLPRPVFNVIAYIQTHKKASVTADSIKMIFSSEEIGDLGLNDKVDTAMKGADLFTKYSETTWERLQQDKLNDELLISASNCGTGLLHYFWNNNISGGISLQYKGDFEGEFLDPANVFFGNPQCNDVQKQPYIIISHRELLDNIKDLAKKNGVSEEYLALLQEDNNTQEELYDSAKFEMEDVPKVTVLTEYYKKNGKVYFKRTANDVLVVKETDTGLTLYPVAIMTWRPRKKCIYGIGDTEGLITNQKGINFSLAMMLLAQQQTGWPKLLAKPGAIKQTITNTPGEIITDYWVGQGDGIKYMQTGSFSSNTFGLVDKFIELTKSLSGANEAAMGEAPGADMSAQAIMLLQKSSGVPLEDIKKRFYACMEDVGRIWADMWKNKYNIKRKIKIKDDEGNEMMEEFSGIDFQESPINLKIDIGPSSVYSEYASQGNLDRLYDKGHIDLSTYLKYSSKSAIPFKDALRQEIEKKAAMLPAPGPSNSEFPPAPMDGPLINNELIGSDVNGGI